MSIAASVIDAIGNTPLIRLNAVSEATGCEIFGKAEFMNPGQSVKDRAALGIIRDAEQRGLLRGEWGQTDNNRKARFYALTAAGKRRLSTEKAEWDRMTSIMRTVLDEQS